MEPERSYHWPIVRRAIERLDAAPGLSLEQIASEMNLSPAHFQRVFSRWAGVSPKRFQQALALSRAKGRLAAQASMIEAAQDAHLSGPSRLHDLFVTWEAMTPGAYARAGDGLVIAWDHRDGPFGPMVAMSTDRGLCALAFADEGGVEATRVDLAARWPAARYVHDADALAPHWAGVLGGGARLHLMGAPFQIKVWEALLTIPSGQVTTYGEIARRIGQPGASRAVGTAVGRNPVTWLIPCHRVIRASGAMGGYRWGPAVKRALLAHEAAALA